MPNSVLSAESRSQIELLLPKSVPAPPAIALLAAVFCLFKFKNVLIGFAEIEFVLKGCEAMALIK